MVPKKDSKKEPVHWGVLAQRAFFQLVKESLDVHNKSMKKHAERISECAARLNARRDLEGGWGSEASAPPKY